MLEYLLDSSVPFATKQSLRATSLYRKSSLSRKNNNQKFTSSKGKEATSTLTSAAPTLLSFSSKMTQVPHCLLHRVKASIFLKNYSSNKENLVWKGVGLHDLQMWQTGRMKWNRHLRNRGGDLSAASAIYYTNKARYALAWEATELVP